jgi:hypothetical protein
LHIAIHDDSLLILIINNKKDVKVLKIYVVTCPAHAPEVELYSPLPGAAEMEREFRVHPTDGRLHFAAVFFSSTHSLTQLNSTSLQQLQTHTHT